MKEESRNVETGEKGIYTYRQKEDEKRKKKKKTIKSRRQG